MAVSQFKAFVQKNNLDVEILETEDATRTAQEAAIAHGVPVSNIVKSLLVKVGDEYVLFLTPGDRRLDLDSVAKDSSTQKVRMATPDEVKEITGYSIGGVPPFGHSVKLRTVVVEGFDPSSTLVAAAGSGNSVFKISLERLKELVL